MNKLAKALLRLTDLRFPLGVGAKAGTHVNIDLLESYDSSCDGTILASVRVTVLAAGSTVVGVVLAIGFDIDDCQKGKATGAYWPTDLAGAPPGDTSAEVGTLVFGAGALFGGRTVTVLASAKVRDAAGAEHTEEERHQLVVP